MVLHMFFSHNYARIKVDWYDHLPLEKTLALHNVIILINSIFYKNQNNYFYNIFLEKFSYQLDKNNNRNVFDCIIMLRRKYNHRQSTWEKL